jgi:hypothetical protein
VAWSPARIAQQLRATRILWVGATDDPVVPNAQGASLRDGVRAANPGAYMDLLNLATGTVPWVHQPVTTDGLREYFARELKLVAPLG